jgi:hypothetical protein
MLFKEYEHKGLGITLKYLNFSYIIYHYLLFKFPFVHLCVYSLINEKKDSNGNFIQNVACDRIHPFQKREKHGF